MAKDGPRDLKIKPYVKGEIGAVCMPLAKNIPGGGADKRYGVKCPECGQNCWSSPTTEQIVRESEGCVVAMCTECALKQGGY